MMCRSPAPAVDSRHPRAETGTLPPMSELSQSATPARRTMDGALEGRHGNLLAARRALEQRHRLEVRVRAGDEHSGPAVLLLHL